MKNRKISISVIPEEKGIVFEEKFYEGEGFTRRRIDRQKVFISFEELDEIIKKVERN